MAKGGALAVKVEPVIYEFPVRYQHDRTGWMAWPERPPVSAIGPTKVGARQKLRAAGHAYFRSAARHGDSLPAPPHRIPAAADPIMVCARPG